MCWQYLHFLRTAETISHCDDSVWVPTQETLLIVIAALWITDRSDHLAKPPLAALVRLQGQAEPFRAAQGELSLGPGWKHGALATGKFKVNPQWVINSTERRVCSYQSCSWREWRDLKNLIHRTPGNIQSDCSLWGSNCIIQGSGLKELILGKAAGC